MYQDGRMRKYITIQTGRVKTVYLRNAANGKILRAIPRSKMSKGRGNREIGEDRYNATLTEDKIREIRKRYLPRDKKNSGRALAKEFGVWPTMICAIIQRKRWKHVK